uniref:expansin-B6-like n=1 Tax=Erigeron canadensis TaxID=72917 RepID=UPI001CB96A54|nr:expansin-B6-like [Erigeron canadensis]
MAFNIRNPFSIFASVCLISALFVSHSLCSNDDELFVNRNNGFTPALGTLYGAPNGVGCGEACGLDDNVIRLPPFLSMIAAGNSRIFLQGKGCGDCFQIKCNREPYCSGRPITVTITYECAGKCNDVPYHFDLSSHAFGAMAHPGQAANLRDLGQVDIHFQRVPCNYGTTKIAFKIDKSTSPSWFSTVITYTDKDGGLKAVEIAWTGSDRFIPMRNLWGAVWVVDTNPSTHGPFSFRLTSPTNSVVFAYNAVPMDFKVGHTYFSHVNF